MALLAGSKTSLNAIETFGKPYKKSRSTLLTSIGTLRLLFTSTTTCCIILSLKMNRAAMLPMNKIRSVINIHFIVDFIFDRIAPQMKLKVSNHLTNKIIED